MLNPIDIEQLSKKGILPDIAENQINHFKRGFPYMAISRPATVGDGILAISKEEATKYNSAFELSLQNGLTMTKFVPASGAATRMFKSLYDFINQKGSTHIQHNKESLKFIEHIDKFPFFSELKELSKIQISQARQKVDKALELTEFLLTSKGMNYGNLPKGVLKFHLANGQARTPVTEHLLEGILYEKDKNNLVKIHFTVSHEHEAFFRKIVETDGPELEKKFGVQFNVTFSNQKPSTDTIAVNPDNTPFRTHEGHLLFRPAGHGALIENLNDIQSDIIFIKNIDNVVPPHLVSDTVLYKKLTAGVLCTIRNEVFDMLHSLPKLNDEDVKKVIDRWRQNAILPVPKSILQLQGSQLKQALFTFLNRPIRVCGMVRNEGEPGGGPFWVKEKDGSESLQIVESSQIDLRDPIYKTIVDRSTHFNPVDLVCSVKDYQGKKFELHQYIDPDTGFISEKSLNGKPLKALELPGLWNGAMAKWLTVFVEVPLSTFNPVKTVNDLLRPQHQPI